MNTIYTIDLELTQASREMLDELQERIDKLTEGLTKINDLFEKFLGDANGFQGKVQRDNR